MSLFDSVKLSALSLYSHEERESVCMHVFPYIKEKDIKGECQSFM